MKVLKKRMDKRSLKILEKSELEVQIEKEEEKRALNLSEAVLSKIDSMKFTFPFLSNMLKVGVSQCYLVNLGVQKI